MRATWSRVTVTPLMVTGAFEARAAGAVAGALVVFGSGCFFGAFGTFAGRVAGVFGLAFAAVASRGAKRDESATATARKYLGIINVPQSANPRNSREHRDGIKSSRRRKK